MHGRRCVLLSLCRDRDLLVISATHFIRRISYHLIFTPPLLKALLGPIAAAAYNLTFQLGFATTQICEAVAVAVQTLLAREIADDRSKLPGVKARNVRHLINGSVLVGGAVALTLSTVTFLQRGSVLKGLTSSLDVRRAAEVIFPAVLVTQGKFVSCRVVFGWVSCGVVWCGVVSRNRRRIRPLIFRYYPLTCYPIIFRSPIFSLSFIAQSSYERVRLSG